VIIYTRDSGVREMAMFVQGAQATIFGPSRARVFFNGSNKHRPRAVVGCEELELVCFSHLVIQVRKEFLQHARCGVASHADGEADGGVRWRVLVRRQP
jgi:hypothetical protein